MKIVTSLWAKSILMIVLIGGIMATEIGIGGLKKGRMSHKKLRLNETPAVPEPQKQDNLPDIPIYFQGWIKYLHYTEKDVKKPKAFYKNTEFDRQSKRGISGKALTATDKGGFIDIPNELYFYSILYKETMNIFSTRKDGISNAVDSLDINYIRPISEDDHFSGGVSDFGKFDEGFCFKIKTKIPSEPFTPTGENPEPLTGVDQTWVICLDKETEKSKLMTTIIKIKLNMQHEKGIYLETAKNEEEVKPQGAPDSIEDISKNMKQGASGNSTDGYWILLQDWTQCTLKCGGGLQYQQMMCVPPKTGGKPCEGPAVRTRPCNTQPCPQPQVVQKTINPVDNNIMKPNNNTLAPIVKMMAVSQRPTRYDKCYIKEADALMEKNDASTASMFIKPKIPVRLVLNDKTVTAYLDDTLTNNVGTFNLEETVLVRLTNEKRCFKLKTNSKQALFCQLDSTGGDFLEEWDYDFNLFKHQCKKKRAVSSNILQEEKKLEKAFKKKIDDVKAEMVIEIAEKAKEKVEKNEEIKYTQKIQQVQSTSILAIQKESKLEELLEKEEAAKEENENKVLEDEIESEKKKADCLNKVIKEKELENQMNIAKSHAEETIKTIQEQTKKEVARKRLEIKKKIMEMRKKQERKKAALKNEIMNIRTTIANKINKLSKSGNPSNCSNPSTDVQRQNYCAINFSDNYLKYQDCLGETSFCYVCCENEFGDFHVLERDKCYAKCDISKNVSF